MEVKRPKLWQALLACLPAALLPPAALPDGLNERIEELNSKCRGGSGDDPRTIAACEERDRLFRQAKTVDPLNPQALEVALVECDDVGLARGDSNWASKCKAAVTNSFARLDHHRQNPMNKRHIWAACAMASGFSYASTPWTIQSFDVCVYRMMERCNAGAKDGNAASEMSCVRAIHSLGWTQN